MLEPGPPPGTAQAVTTGIAGSGYPCIARANKLGAGRAGPFISDRRSEGRYGSRVEGVSPAARTEGGQAVRISWLPCSVAFHVERAWPRPPTVMIRSVPRAKKPFQPEYRLSSPAQSTRPSADAESSDEQTTLAMPGPCSRPRADPKQRIETRPEGPAGACPGTPHWTIGPGLAIKLPAK